MMNFDGFSGNAFSSNGDLLDWCGGQSLLNDPYKPSNGIYNTDRAWAGIYFRGFHTNSIGDSGSPMNTFTGLANGIVLHYSSVGEMASPGTITGGITQCKFDNIRRGDYAPNLGGSGISFLDSSSGSHFMKQTGSGMNNTIEPSFNDCEIGIYAQYHYWGTASIIESSDNRMENMHIGYYIDGLQGVINTSITHNHIHSNQDFAAGVQPGGVRVELGTQTDNAKININGNTILVEQQNLSSSSGVTIFNPLLLASPTSGEITVNDNNITIGGEASVSAIVLSNLQSPIAQYNIITINEDIYSDGINDWSCNNTSLLCNDITGPTPSGITQIQAGLGIAFSTDSQIRDNHIANFDKGVEFDYFCGSEMDFSCNSILGNNVNGLFYSAFAMTNEQEDKGNIWNCNSSAFEAENISFNFNEEKYTAETGTNAFPDSHAPTSWFEPSTNPTPSCPVNPNCPLILIEKEINELDVSIAEGLPSEPYGIVYSAEQSLYKKLKEAPDLLIGDTLMQAFLNTKENMPIGEFYDLSVSMSELFEIVPATKAQLDSNATAIESHLAQMRAIDAILAANPPEPQYSNYVQQYNQHAQDVVQLSDENESIYQTLHASRLVLADNLLTTNSAINAVAVYEQNEQKFYEIFLNTVGKDTTGASTAQLDTLASIADQCPADGGRVVLWAIALHNLLTGGNLTMRECPVSTRSQEEGESSPSFQNNHFGLSPNPANETCKINYKIEKGAKGDLYLFDLYGRQIAAFQLVNLTGTLEVDDLSPGVYFVQLSINGRMVQTEKLVKH